MNTILIAETVLRTQDSPFMAKIIFWLLLLLWAIGVFGWHDNPVWVKGSNILLIVLFAILGWFTFGF